MTNEISPLSSPCKTTTPPPRLEVLQEIPQEGLQRSSTFRTFLEQAVDDINNKYKTTSATCLQRNRLGSIANSEDMGTSSFYSTACARATFQPRYRLPTFVEKPPLPVQPASGEVREEIITKNEPLRLPDTDKTADISAIVTTSEPEESTSATSSLEPTTSLESSNTSEGTEMTDASKTSKDFHKKSATDGSCAPSSLLMEIDDADPFGCHEKREDMNRTEECILQDKKHEFEQMSVNSEECDPFSDTAHVVDATKTSVIFSDEAKEMSESEGDTDENGSVSSEDESDETDEQILQAYRQENRPGTPVDENSPQQVRYRNCSAPSVADLVSKFRNLEQPHGRPDCNTTTPEQEANVDVTEKIIKSYRRHHCDESETSSSEDDGQMGMAQENGRCTHSNTSMSVGAWPGQWQGGL